MATATLVSLVPREIREFKPGLVEPHVIIPAAPMNDFVTRHIHDNAYPLYLDAERGSRLIPEPVGMFAEAIVRDFVIAQIEIELETNSIPGLFWVYNSIGREAIKKDHAALLAQNLANQTRWFQRLVRRADDDWNRFHMHSSIADIQRIAARSLNLEREWMYVTAEVGNERCPACSSILTVPPPVVCPTCQCILDKTKYSRLEFAK